MASGAGDAEEGGRAYHRTSCTSSSISIGRSSRRARTAAEDGRVRDPGLRACPTRSRVHRRRARRSHRVRITAAGSAPCISGFPDESFPPDHPQQWLGDYGVGAVAYDLFPADSPIRRLYEWDELTRFVAAMLELDAIYPYADPLGALNLAVMGDGEELQWHFDQTDFVVSLALQDADDGRRLRGGAADPHEPTTSTTTMSRRVLAGDTSTVVTLPMTPGTLLVFAGRNSMHRVSPIRGTTPRLVALLGYDTKPGTMSSELLKAVRYGRTA